MVKNNVAPGDIFLSGCAERDVEAARDFCRNNGLTKEDVRIITKNGDLFVVAKREFYYGGFDA